MAKETNRLAKIISELAKKYEIPYKPDDDGLGGDIGIPDDKDMFYVAYSFSENEDSYEFGCALAKLENNEIPRISEGIVRSVPIRGLSMHLDSQNKIIVQGSRDGLKAQNLKQIELFFLDEWARVAEANDSIKNLLNK